MPNKENVVQAIKELSETFQLEMPNKKEKILKIEQREHIYKNADGSIFEKKVLNKFSDGNKNAIWYLFDPATGKFNQNAGLNGKKPLFTMQTYCIIIVFTSYLIITIIDFIRIRHIPKVLALKNME